MALEMKVPSPGESITEVEIAQWLVEDGDYVEKDQAIAEVDSDKATLELPAEDSGIITLKAEEGDLVQVGGVVCLIDVDAQKPADFEAKKSVVSEQNVAIPDPGPAKTAVDKSIKATPVAKEMIAVNDINPSEIKGSGSNGKITKKDIGLYLNGAEGKQGERKKMSMLRRKVAKRLVAVKNETAMLTTFNEVDMKPIMDIRTIYKEAFKEKYGVGLGFMSFFTKAVTNALKEFPAVNAMIDGDYMVSFDFADIGIAVSSPKGLMVPVVREAQDLNFAAIESEIKRLAIKARDGKIDLSDMEGGTFTITNGGVFGSMLSTPHY